MGSGPLNGSAGRETETLCPSGPVERDVEERAVAEALDAEVEYVLALGGWVVRLPGANLVLHEKIPAPRVNYVSVGRIAPQRQTAFFERALDQYFQRAIRPRFRLPSPAPPHLRAGLERLGFRRKADPLVLLLEATSPTSEERLESPIRPARDTDLDALAEFWAAPKERPEFRTALDIAWHHPNPDERLLPIVQRDDAGVVGAALLYRYRHAAAIDLVGTRAASRGRGTASDLVRYALRARPQGGPVRFAMLADSGRLVDRLTALGFAPAAAFEEYELSAEADLALPEPGPPGPPRWRPPRGL